MLLEQRKDAEATTRIALGLHVDPIDRIHLAEALLYQKKVDDVCVEIDRLRSTDLKTPARDDYALAFAAIAIWSEDQARLEAKKSFSKLMNRLSLIFLTKGA